MVEGNINSANTIVEIARTLGPALITGLVAYAISRIQLKSKAIELDGQTKLRAKELLFNAYQEQLERLHLGSRKTFNSIGEMAGRWTATKDEGDKREILDGILVLGRLGIKAHTEFVSELQSKLQDANLLNNKRRSQLSELVEISSLDFVMNEETDGEEIIKKMVRFFVVLLDLEEALLEEKRKELFGAYLS